MLQTIQSLPVIHAPILEKESWLQHGFGLKDVTIENYLKAYGLRTAIPQTNQTHGCTVHILGSKNIPLDGDAFLTDQSGVVCWVRTADCLPILIADPQNQVIGAVHAGWRGTASKIVLAALEKMQAKWGSRPQDLKVALGPAIGGQCYQVGPDVVAQFEKAGLHAGAWMEKIDRRHWFLDIAFANQAMLEEAGVLRERIYLSLACTACDLEKFHSFRKEKGKKGEQVSFIFK